MTMINHGTFEGGNDRLTTTAASLLSILLLGSGYDYNGVSLTHDEVEALQKAYIFHNNHNKLEHTGNMRTLFRLIERDGIRVLALLAQHLEPGQDPIDLVIKLFHNSGYDCSSLLEFI